LLNIGNKEKKPPVFTVLSRDRVASNTPGTSVTGEVCSALHCPSLGKQR